MAGSSEATSDTAVSSLASRRGAIVGHAFVDGDPPVVLASCADCGTILARAAGAAENGQDSICEGWLDRRTGSLDDTRAELERATGHPANSFFPDRA